MPLPLSACPYLVNHVDSSIEDVAAATDAPFWFQLYTLTDEDYSDRLIQAVKDANCSALVITLDLQVLGQRHKD